MVTLDMMDTELLLPNLNSEIILFINHQYPGLVCIVGLGESET